MIEIKNVRVLGGLVFVEHLYFSKGVYYIKGDSGSGKTSLLKCVTKDISYEGNVSIQGSVVGYYQDCVLNYNCSLYDMLNMDCSINKKVYYELLLSLDMIDLEKKKSCQLSKGEKQRAELILTLSCNRDIYVLDEPCGSLNYKYRRFIYSWINKNMKDMVFLVATHDAVDKYVHIVDGIVECYCDVRRVNKKKYNDYNDCNWKILKKLWFNIPKTIINILNVALSLLCLYFSFNINDFFDKNDIIIYVLSKMKNSIYNLKVLSVIFGFLSIVMYMMYFILDIYNHQKCIVNFKRRFAPFKVNKYIVIRLVVEIGIIVLLFLIGVLLIKLKYD